MRIVAVLVVVLGAIVASGTDLPDPDIWWNVDDGSFRLDHRLHDPPLSFYGAHGCDDASPLVTDVPDVSLGLAWRAGGMWGLVVVRALLVFAIGLAVVFARRRRDTALTLALAFATMGTLSARASPRPELFAVALLAWTSAWAVGKREFRLVDGAVGFALCAVLAWTHALAPVAPFIAVVVAALSRERDAWKRAGCCVLGFVARPMVVLAPFHALHESAIAKAMQFREFASLATLLDEGYRHPWLANAGVLVVTAIAVAASGGRDHSVGGVGGVTAVRDPGGAPPIEGTPLVARSRPPEAATAIALAVVAVATTFLSVRLLVLLPAFAPVVAHAAHLRRNLARVVVAAAFVAFGFVVVDRAANDPIALGKSPPDFAPSRIDPLGAAQFLVDTHASGTLYAPLHASSFVLFAVPDVHPLWSGRRTYSLECGLTLLAGRAGNFAPVDDRWRPDWVLVDVAQEPALADAVIARGFSLAYVDVQYALFARAPAAALEASPEHVAGADNRPVDAPSLAAMLDRVCALLQKSAPSSSAQVCAASARMHGGLTPSEPRR